MPMRLFLGDTDARYLERMKMWLDRDYSQEIQVSTYNDRNSMLRDLRQKGADVALVSREFAPELQMLRIAGAARAAWLGEEDGTDTDTGERILGKYKRMDLLAEAVRGMVPDSRAASQDIPSGYPPMGRAEEKQRTVMLDDYGMAEPAFGSDSVRVIAVTSFSGGTGATTISTALARNLKAEGKETIYLNLELLNSAGKLFSGGGSGTLRDALDIIRTGAPEPMVQIRRILCRTASGIAFFREREDGLNLQNTSGEDLVSLITAIRYSGVFSYIVIDLNYTGRPADVQVLDCADVILVVNDGTQTANRKLSAAMKSLGQLAQETGIDFSGRMQLLFNRFSSSKSSREPENVNLPLAGKIPPIMHATTEEIAAYLAAKSDIIRKIR